MSSPALLIDRAAPRRVFFERVLLPYRSLPPRGFNVLMLMLAGVSVAVGTLFVTLGAWPVCGFFGLDVGLVYLAFRLSYRSARQRETLSLADDELTVERVGIRGDRSLWRFQPFWVRVVYEEGHGDSNRLALASHGRSLPIGTFLPAPVRHEVAATLRDALRRWRDAHNPAQR
ncbi:MAG: DUF2244 domain-containing protein [Alphaproteobacteria bacterium]|nr:DUF2244 domain-containing protein [Alphaproteobacteria bacterium]